ncbi:hypothetical protein [Erwinia sp. JH02]|uniref:hypothetical protein n=1 Tax=Erwinia sp. JH02 TaxID=2733394 RepID=UPI00148A03D7|nr:hypothetical protein [Erwinia sp. JH02]NNS07288.1 hypothetical protein [Erwinia sp. JH02]
MKKVAMYRRGRGGPNDGLKEKIVWLLSKWPMTGRQLHMATKLPLRSIHRQLNAQRHLISATAEISAGEWYIDEETAQRDRLYTLVRNPRRITSAAATNKTIVVSINSLRDRGEEQRQACIEAAARRARLMKAGLWITSSDLTG